VNTGDLIINNPGNVLARKASVAPLISDYRPIGNHFINSVVFANGISFFDSTDTTVGSEGSQVQVFDRNDGYEISVPADTTPRTLQLYVGAELARAKVSAFLSDGSADVVNDTSFDDPNGPDFSGFGANSVYSITYSAASAGQTLTVRYTMDFDYGRGQVALLGAALNGSPVVPTVPAPQIASLSPMSAAINTRLTITGTNFGTQQGDSLVFISTFAAQVVSWSDTSVVAIVPAGLTGGQSAEVQVITDSGFSNTESLNILNYKVQPQDLNMLVGDSRTLLVTDLSGNPISGLGWATSDPTIVTLSTDDPPVITAVGAGSTKVWAGDIPVSVTVFAGIALPPGTPIWTLPVGGGTGNISLVPAVPSVSGADVFAVDDSGTLTAISSDGFPVWKISGVHGGSSAKIIPDFSGNAFLKTPFTFTDAQGHPHSTHKIQKADPSTSQITDLYTYADQEKQFHDFDDSGSIQAAIPDTTGKLFIEDNASVNIIDPTGAQPTVNLSLDSSTVNGVPQAPVIGEMIVAGDGNAYTPYVYSEETDSTSGSTSTTHNVTHLMLLRASADGTSAKTELKSWTFDSTCIPWTPPGGAPDSGTQCNTSGPSPSVTNLSVITNGDQGAAEFTTTVLTGCSTEFFSSPGIVDHETGCGDTLAHTELDYVSQDVVTSQIPDAVVLPNDDGRLQAFVPALQREDGSYIGTDTTSEIFGWSNLIAVGSAGGVLWNQPVTSAPTYITPLYATVDGGMIVQSKQVQNCQSNPPQCDTVGTPISIVINQSGASTAQHTATNESFSWLGNSYSPAAANVSGAISLIQGDSVALAGTFAALSGGNHSGTGAAIQQVLTNKAQADEEQLPDLSHPSCPLFPLNAIDAFAPGFGFVTPTCGNINAIELLTDKSPDFIFRTYLQTFSPGILNPNTGRPNNGVMIFTGSGNQPINVTSAGQKLTIALQGIARLGQGPFSVLTERVDPVNHVISVVTLKGHPLAGWRYWRVYSIAANDVVVETGAYDQPGPGLKNYIGYYYTPAMVSKGWRQFVQFVQNDLHVSRGSTFSHLGSDPTVIPSDALLDGFWDVSGAYTGFILNNICQAASCN